MKSYTHLIDQIFNAGVSIKVPFFQRSYVWGEEEWKKFLSDMDSLCKQNKPYFLGAIILKNLDNEGTRKSIVDGQQRITTLLILLKILSLKSAEKIKQKFYFYFQTDTPDGEEEIKLIHSYYDREAFEKVFMLDSLKELTGENRIIKAYNFFKDNVDTYNLDFRKIISKVNLVDIEIDADEDEQQIFETINSVGRKLTTGELLKNFIFKDSDIENYKNIWVPAFEKDEDCIKYWESSITAGRNKRSNTESFFHAFLQIKMQSSEYNVPSDEKAIFRKANSVFNNYQTFIGKYIPNSEIIPFAKEIAAYAKIFKDSFEVDCTHQHITEESSIERINFIIYTFDATTMIPYVMYVLKNAEKEEQSKIFELLEAYVVRRFICKESNKNYSDMFNEELTAKEIKTYDRLKAIIAEKEGSSLRMPNDSDVTYAFHNVALNNAQAKGILYLLESKLRSQKHSTCLAPCFKYELEHLMPKKWEKKWALTDGYSVQDRNDIIKTLGNLMIISGALNSSISNADWTTKKSGNNKHEGLSKYANDIEIWNGALGLPVWNENAIKDRAEKLAMQANRVWRDIYAETTTTYSSDSGFIAEPTTVMGACETEVPQTSYEKKPEPKKEKFLFSLEGGKALSMARFVPHLVKTILEKEPTLTFAEMQNIFPDDLMSTGFKAEGLLVTEEKLNNSTKMTDSRKHKCYYADDSSFRLVSGDGVAFFVSTQWTMESFQNIIEAAKKRGLKITSESATSK